ncbi:MAG: peptidase [Chitinophagaceae bacterium]|nr:MAG: peptidase [Chitinophagaceae bacterium]
MKTAAIILLVFVIVCSFYFFRRRNKTHAEASEDLIDKSLLAKHVNFYSGLDDVGKREFEEAVHFFLSHTRITGVDTAVTTLDRMLIAAGAVIPIFHFKKWRYYNLREVLLYSDAINHNFESKGNSDRNILGMVGSGVYNNMMFLSKASLHSGFENKSDKHNTTIHEFVHLLDKADGDTDGIPDLLIDKKYVLPWVNMIHENMQQIARGKSDIDSYAFTNKAEFFAVAAEYFFEQPALLEAKHPELFKMLANMFELPDTERNNESGL